MKLLRVTNKNINYAKRFCVSKKFICLFTGNRVVILDRKLNYIHEVKNLKYAYTGYVSPDESKLLIVSIRNGFYVLSLTDYTLRKCTVGGSYKGNLEGRGCWNMEGGAVYIPVQNRESMKSTLRKYYVDKDFEFEDLLIEKYWIVHVSLCNSLKKYLIVGMDRRTGDQCLIWYDENDFKEYKIESFDDAIIHVEVNEHDETISIFGAWENVRCDFTGKKVGTFATLPLEPPKKSSKSLTDPSLEVKVRELIKEVVTNLQDSDFDLNDRLNIAVFSSDLKYIYIGTTTYLIIADANSGTILKSKRIEYGVERISEIEDHIILVSSWTGVKVFKIEP